MSDSEHYDEEANEITDLSNPDVISKYKIAADIVNKSLQGVLTLIQAGKSISDICAFGDLLIEKQSAEFYKNKGVEKGIAFPTCVSVNNVVCHNSPLSSESTILAAGDIVKIDMGSHIDGFIAVAAQTVVIPSETPIPKAARINDLMSAAGIMGDVCLRLMKPGHKNSEVTEALRKVANAYNVEIVKGTLMHQMKQFVIDGNKVVIAHESPEEKVDEFEFALNEVYAVDIALTVGNGQTRSIGDRCTVYRRNVEENYMLRMKSSKALLSQINQKFPVFPFSLRALDAKTARLGVLELLNHRMLLDYPVITTKDGEYTIHYKFTILIVPNGVERITGTRIDISKYPTDKKCEDEGIVALLRTPAMLNKKKQKKKSAAAETKEE